MKINKELMVKFSKQGQYCRFPDSLKMNLEIPFEQDKVDVFGVNDRWRAIKKVTKDFQLGNIIDLGGHSGYFSLSAIDCGLAKSAQVYDINVGALEVGRLMADEMGISDKIQFIEQSINLDYITKMHSGDTVFCLNLLHHAGVLFDIAEVTKNGWEIYAKTWLEEFRKRFKYAIIGVGFKATKPREWSISDYEKPGRFVRLLKEADWNVIYDANIQDIHTFGILLANKLRRNPYMNRVLMLSQSGRNFIPGFAKKKNKRYKYYIYILE